MQDSFRIFSRATADVLGSNRAFIVAVMTILVWGVTGPLFGYSDTWQLAINTGTTIVTFLMVFLIQNTQNRDSLAMQLKLDELLRAVGEARTNMVDLESRSDEELHRIKRELSDISQAEAASDLPDSLH
ncbi:MAG TPA: low affinity iron permease family protein [Pirellulales bacterium]